MADDSNPSSKDRAATNGPPTPNRGRERSNSFGARGTLQVGDRSYEIFRLQTPALTAEHDIARLPYGIKVLLENLLRHEDGRHVSEADIAALADWGRDPGRHGKPEHAEEIAFTPERVLMQDLTGVPAVVDLAAMRDALTTLGGDPKQINPLAPVELVIDHSVIADKSGTASAFKDNVRIEMERNLERYTLLRWAQESFSGLKVVPPGTGICHQVNLEYLSRVVFESSGGQAFCDTLVGTDSHTTMVNGLGVLGWGVGGIEAEAAMLGQPLSMLMPPVLGLRLSGELPEGTTATDLVLTITELLRRQGVVGSFVECFGPGIASVPVENRATIGNMSPEYGATCTLFPIDQATIDYLRFTGRSPEHLALVEAYAKEQGLWHEPGGDEPVYSRTAELDLGTVAPSLAGPSRPQDRVSLDRIRTSFRQAIAGRASSSSDSSEEDTPVHNGDVVIAAITSCTNTSNPQVMVAAGLLAKKAMEKGLTPKPWVKASLAPGSLVVMDYLERAGLVEPLEKLGFYLVGFGCTTCIGNSGPLLPGISETIHQRDLAVASVLSGNRNFEGRIHPDVRLSYLASPPLVVAFALAGTVDINPISEPLGTASDGTDVFLTDIWPTSQEVSEVIRTSLGSDMFVTRYAEVFEGDEAWQSVPISSGDTYAWDDSSTYILRPSFFDGMGKEPDLVTDILDARPLAILGNSVTTDHISPAGSISRGTPAARYLNSRGVADDSLHSYGARRGNHEVMVRGTFANVRLRNLMAPGTEGGYTTHWPGGDVTTIFDASMQYQSDGVPLIVIAGREYGTGSSRDWAAKGTFLLGAKAVIAESFERIHRSNLIGMGVLPLQFPAGTNAESLGLTGDEQFRIEGLDPLNRDEIPKEVVVTSTNPEGKTQTWRALVRIDTPMEAAYYRHGGILRYVLRQLADQA